MRWLDALFGRTRLPKPKTDALFTLITAQVDIEADLGWKSADRAALCLKPVTTSEFSQVTSDLESLVQLTATDSGTKVKVHEDEFHYRWFIFTDEDYEDLVSVIHIAAGELAAKGYGEQLLAAVYTFTVDVVGDITKCYLVYSYKRGAFYPFIPKVGHQRDNAAELQAAALLERYLPIEKDHTRWYPLWDCPV